MDLFTQHFINDIMSDLNQFGANWTQKTPNGPQILPLWKMGLEKDFIGICLSRVLKRSVLNHIVRN
jgi:hypothetical protein